MQPTGGVLAQRRIARIAFGKLVVQQLSAGEIILNVLLSAQPQCRDGGPGHHDTLPQRSYQLASHVAPLLMGEQCVMVGPEYWRADKSDKLPWT
jgi:hypothetical protein